MRLSCNDTNGVQSHAVASWVESELSGCRFADARHGTRLSSLLHSMSEDIGQSIPLACEDWANTKAAYRLFSNERVSDKEILSGHFEATQRRVAAVKGPILILHDTTEFIFKRGDSLAVGWPRKHAGETGKGRVPVRLHTRYSVFMHSALVVTPPGVPLGLAAVKLWTRPKKSLRKSLSGRAYKALPIEKKESYRWLENLRDATERLGHPERCIHVGDREADMLALYNCAGETGTHFLVRICNNRVTDDGGASVDSLLQKTPLAGTHSVTFKDAKGATHTADLQIRFRPMRLERSRHKRKDFPPIEVTVIHACEKATPVGRPRLEWKLATNLDVGSLAQAIEKLDWYAMRWKIETFHKILKSGCKVEDSKMRTTHRLTNLIAVSCILAWRIFWMTMINRTHDTVSPKLALTKLETKLLDRLVKDKANTTRKDLSHYIIKIARLGGYLARANDPPPGNMVIWRGYTKLSDIVTGAIEGAELMGN